MVHCSGRWLFACAEAGKIVPVDDHLIKQATPTLPLAATPTSLSDRAQSGGVGMETRVELESNNRTSSVLGGVIIAINKKLGSQESKLLLI